MFNLVLRKEVDNLKTFKKVDGPQMGRYTLSSMENYIKKASLPIQNLRVSAGYVTAILPDIEISVGAGMQEAPLRLQ